MVKEWDLRILVAPTQCISKGNTGTRGGAHELTTISSLGFAFKKRSKSNQKSVSYLNWKKLILQTKEHNMQQTLTQFLLWHLHSYFVILKFDTVM